jgi:hypothetical protein
VERADLDECIDNLREHRPDLTDAQLARTRRLMTIALPDAIVTGYTRSSGATTQRATARRDRSLALRSARSDAPVERDVALWRSLAGGLGQGGR